MRCASATIVLMVLATAIFFCFRKRLVSVGKRWLMAFLGEAPEAAA